MRHPHHDNVAPFSLDCEEEDNLVKEVDEREVEKLNSEEGRCLMPRLVFE